MKHLFVLLTVCSLLQFTACNKDVEIRSRDYPFVVTREAQVFAEGVTLSANIMNTGSEEILEYGFVWSIHPNPTISDMPILLSEGKGKGIYSVTQTAGIVSSQTYFVRAYLKTSRYEVYGNEVRFTAL